MSEDEATEKLKRLVARCKECKFATCENCEINWNEVQAIETILDLYQQEKEKNSKLQKRNDKQFRLLRKKDKEIQEIKDISEHDWEERCRLTFKLEDYISKDKVKEKIEYLDNQQRQWLEDREIKNSDEEICFARDFLTKLLKEEE